MPIDPVQLDPEFLPQAAHQQTEALSLCRSKLLTVEGTHHHNADVRFVLPDNMGALECQTSPLPYAAGRIHDEVVSDVPVPATGMFGEHALQSLDGGHFSAVPERITPRMVDR